MKGRAFARNAATLNPDFPIHGLNEAARNIETQSRTTYLAINIAFESHKTLEKAALVLRCNTFSFIRNADDDDVPAINA